MQRWFFADEREVCIEQPPAEVSEPPTPEQPVTPKPEFERYWRFCVRVSERLLPNELLAVTGNCTSLGMWKFEHCLLMTPSKTQPDLWEVDNVRIARYQSTEYRYLVVAIDEIAQQQIVRRWEAQKQPRVVLGQVVGELKVQPLVEDDFGDLHMDEERVSRVDRGWLTTETIVQFIFKKAPFCLQKPLNDHLLYVRVTPLRMNNDDCYRRTYASLDDDLHRGSELNTEVYTPFAFVEAAILQSGGSTLRDQPKHGNRCGKNDLLLVHCTVGDFESTIYRIDLYTYSSKAASDEPAYHFGYQYVPVSMFSEQHRTQASGSFNLTVMCATKHRPLGNMTVDFLIVRPMNPPLELNMRVSYTRHWLLKYSRLEVGHRGCGPTYYTHEKGSVRENTIYSLEHAVAYGADMVEMDVHLTKDLVPVLVHEFQIPVTQQRKKILQKKDFVQRRICDFTLKELQGLRASPYGEGYYWHDECLPEYEEEAQQPFPTLASALQRIDLYVGFIIEIKWPQLLQSGRPESKLSPTNDKNRHIDTILDVVFQHADKRRIALSSFDADSCTMLRYKQNLYPVLHVINGVVHAEPRCRSLEAAVCNALTLQLLGIVLRARELLEVPIRIKIAHDEGLVVFCFGKEMDSKEVINAIKDLGVQGAIYDRIDRVSTKAAERSIFYLNKYAARASQTHLCRYQMKDVQCEICKFA